MRKKLTNDLWGLNKNMNWAFPSEIEIYEKRDSGTGVCLRILRNF